MKTSTKLLIGLVVLAAIGVSRTLDKETTDCALVLLGAAGFGIFAAGGLGSSDAEPY